MYTSVTKQNPKIGGKDDPAENSIDQRVSDKDSSFDKLTIKNQ